MGVSLDEAKPALSPTAKFQRRSDGSGGVYDPSTGASLEVAPDQASLLALLDGQRTLAAVMEAHYAAYRSMPLAALDDLLTKLSDAGVLAGAAHRAARPKAFIARLAAPRILLRAPIPVLGAIAGLLSLVTLFLFALAPPPLEPLSTRDVLLALAGAVLAHTARRWFQGAALFAMGAPVSHLELGLTSGFPHLGPDVGASVLLNRGPRAGSLVAGLLGLGATFLLASLYSRGLAFGAGVVLVAELCPFAPTLTGKLLATLAGKVDLQEHARAYIDRRLLRRVASSQTFDGETSLVWTTLFSLGWLGLVVRLVFTKGAVTTLRLLALSVDEEGASKLILQAGAVVLALLLPLSLIALAAAVVRAFLALRPPKATDAGVATPTGTAKTDLATIPLFARLPDTERQALAAVGEERHFHKAATLVAQGATGDRFFAILSGHVSVHVEADSGLSREVARLGPGDCFGEAALLGEGKRTATVKAEDDVTVLSLGTDAFARLAGQLGAAQLSGVIRTSAALKKSAFFGALPAERLSSLAFHLAPRPVTPGEVLIELGQKGEACFLVSEGKFEVLGDEGKTVATLGPGDHFGEVALLRDVPRTATVRAVEPGVVLSLSREEFLSAVTRDLGLSRRLEALAAQRVEAAR